MSKGEVAGGWVEVELGVVGEEGLDDVFVFFGFEGAGTVDDGAVGFEVRGGVGEERLLLFGEGADVLKVAVPAHVGVVVEDAED